MSIDCSNYDNKNCPKEQILKRKVVSDTLNVLMVGCWGVYCWDGPIQTFEYDTDMKKIVYPEKKAEYGSLRVVNGMIKYSEKNTTHALFLAGDNVYDYNEPKDKLIELIKSGNPPDKKSYKKDDKISGQNIDKQLQEGFLKCVKKVNVPDFFIAIGNHDIQTCYDLNRQLNFSTESKNNYNLPSLYYNVVYELNDYKVNFIVLDTNVFEDKAINCYGNEYKLEEKLKLIDDQIAWVIKTLLTNNCEWNIIIGHIPYKANLHKNPKKKELDHKINNQLNYLFHYIKLIEDKGPKVQVYFCADEHNQQFLYDNDTNMSLIVAGSGGTKLDKNIINGRYFNSEQAPVYTAYTSNNFGFTSFNFNKENLKITFFDSVDKDNSIIKKFETNIKCDGTILNKTLF